MRRQDGNLAGWWPSRSVLHQGGSPVAGSPNSSPVQHPFVAKWCCIPSGLCYPAAPGQAGQSPSACEAAVLTVEKAHPPLTKRLCIETTGPTDVCSCRCERKVAALWKGKPFKRPYLFPLKRQTAACAFHAFHITSSLLSFLSENKKSSCPAGDDPCCNQLEDSTNSKIPMLSQRVHDGCCTFLYVNYNSDPKIVPLITAVHNGFSSGNKQQGTRSPQGSAHPPTHSSSRMNRRSVTMISHAISANWCLAGNPSRAPSHPFSRSHRVSLRATISQHCSTSSMGSLLLHLGGTGQGCSEEQSQVCQPLPSQCMWICTMRCF